MGILQQVRQMVSRVLQTDEMKARLASLKSEIKNKAMNWQDNTVELKKLIGEVEELSHVSTEFKELYEELHSKYNLKALDSETIEKKKRPRDDSQGGPTGQRRSSMQKIGQASNPYIVKILPTMAQLEL